MLTEYHNLLAGAVLRILVLGCVLFTLVPSLLFPGALPEERWRRRMAGFLSMGALLVIVAHVLVLGSMYDGLVLATVFVGIGAVSGWLRTSRGSARGFAEIFANFLRALDSLSWKNVWSWGKRKAMELAGRTKLHDSLSVAILALVIVMTGISRLVPVWNHAAPFSIEYYDTLQHSKLLQLNRMYEGGYFVPLGLPALAESFSLLSQVNVSIILHFLGAVSSMILAGSIAYVVYRATFSLQGSALSAAIFGIFSSLLPMDLRSQVEADGLVLASAFALPALSFLIEFFVTPSRSILIFACAGIFVALMMNLFIGFVTIAGGYVIFLAALAFAHRFTWLRGKRLWKTVLIGFLLLGGFLLFVIVGLERESIRNTFGVLMYAKHINRYFTMYDGIPTYTLWGSAALFVSMMLLSAGKYSLNHIGVHLFAWGALGAIALAIVNEITEGSSWILSLSQMAFVLSVLIAVAAGNLLGVWIRVTNWLFKREKVRRFAAYAWNDVSLISLLAILLFTTPRQEITFEYTSEPDGFAASMYLIEQQYTPYRWTVVSHQGTALVGMSRGRFLDYDYFCQHYSSESYTHGAQGAVPTPVIFFFVERTRESTEIATELMTSNRYAAENMRRWLEDYQKSHRDLKVFYSDEKVIVYQLEDPTAKALRG